MIGKDKLLQALENDLEIAIEGAEILISESNLNQMKLFHH